MGTLTIKQFNYFYQPAKKRAKDDWAALRKAVTGGDPKKIASAQKQFQASFEKLLDIEEQIKEKTAVYNI
jgi:hypothetical protein